MTPSAVVEVRDSALILRCRRSPRVTRLRCRHSSRRGSCRPTRWQMGGRRSMHRRKRRDIEGRSRRWTTTIVAASRPIEGRRRSVPRRVDGRVVSCVRARSAPGIRPPSRTAPTDRWPARAPARRGAARRPGIVTGARPAGGALRDHLPEAPRAMHAAGGQARSRATRIRARTHPTGRRWSCRP